jgi:hypothetical protein
MPFHGVQQLLSPAAAYAPDADQTARSLVKVRAGILAACQFDGVIRWSGDAQSGSPAADSGQHELVHATPSGWATEVARVEDDVVKRNTGSSTGSWHKRCLSNR